MPTEPDPVTVSQVVRRAVEACELGDVDDRLDDLLLRFEDADEPIAAVPDIEQRIAEVTGTLDPEGDDPALAMAGAVIVYLAFRRDEIAEDAEELLRLAARAEFDGSPPPSVRQWLDEAGVRV